MPYECPSTLGTSTADIVSYGNLGQVPHPNYRCMLDMVNQRVQINLHSLLLWSLIMVLVRASPALEEGVTAPSTALLRIELERMVMGLVLVLISLLPLLNRN